jgi:hypothetical protein
VGHRALAPTEVSARPMATDMACCDSAGSLAIVGPPMTHEGPTAWLGDPVAVHVTDRGDVVISAPPAERDVLVISLDDAPILDDPSRSTTTFVRVNLAGARSLVRGLKAAISQIEEHAGS